VGDALEQGMNAYQAGDYERAVAVLGQLLEEDPTQVAARLWLGVSMVAQGEEDRAIFMFKRVLKETTDPEIRAYAQEMLTQRGISVAEEPLVPVLPPSAMAPCNISFNNLLREICLLSDPELVEVLPWFQTYIQDVQAFETGLTAGFRGREASALVLAGLLGLDSPRRQAECKSRLQSFLNAPNRVREQILGVYLRSLDPSAGETGALK